MLKVQCFVISEISKLELAQFVDSCLSLISVVLQCY